MPHIEELQVENYRVLRNVALSELQPLNVVLGPNGCGKSTLFDVFGFLAEALQTNVRKALEPRGRLRELQSRGARKPLALTLRYRESDFGAKKSPLITYHLAIDEARGKPVIVEEYLRWTRSAKAGRPFKFLELKQGRGRVITGEVPEKNDERREVVLDSPDILAIKALGQLTENPRVTSLRRFVEGWFLSYFVPDQARQVPEAGAKEHLSRTGENLPNVVQYLSEEHPQILASVLKRVAKRIPGLERVESKRTEDGRLALRFKDGPFNDPFLARFVSDGTIKMFAYLVLLSDPEPPPLLCIEEPENGLHPKLLPILAEELRAHATKTQVFVSSHSPYFVNALRPEELWIMDRGKDGFATVERADRIAGVPEFVAEGAALGSLWSEGQFHRGNP
jgi:predicted ATPase